MIKVSHGWECGGRLIQTTIICLFVSYSLDLCPHFKMSLQTDLEISRSHKIPQGRGIFRFWVIKTPLDIFLGGFAKVLCTRELMPLLHCRQQSYPSFQNSTFFSNRLTPPCGIAAVRNQAGMIPHQRHFPFFFVKCVGCTSVALGSSFFLELELWMVSHQTGAGNKVRFSGRALILKEVKKSHLLGNNHLLCMSKNTEQKLSGLGLVETNKECSQEFPFYK